MKEYIERQAVIDELLKGTIITSDLYGMGIMSGLDFAVKKVADAPAADVVEVKHSSWMPYFEHVEIYNTGGYREKKQTGWICKKCKSRKSFTTVKENYCSYCGAKMDTEE